MLQLCIMTQEEKKKLPNKGDILTLLKEFRHDVLIMVGRLYFFSNVGSGAVQVLWNAAKRFNEVKRHRDGVFAAFCLCVAVGGVLYLGGLC